jgi:uncharacterized protein (TIGR01777 family)
MLGLALCAALEQRQSATIRLVRRQAEGREELHWDPASPAPIPELRALEGLDSAIHLSGANLAAHRWTPKFLREMTASRVDSTRALATALARLRQPPRSLLVASAVGIYGNRADQVLDESSSPGTGLLADLCRAWEAAAAPAVEAGIRVAHLRFGVVLAAGSGALARMLPIFRLGLGGRLGSGKQWMSWIGLRDLVAATLFALDRPALTGALNLTSPQPVTNAEFTRILARRLHRPAILPAPAFALRIALGKMADEALLSSTRAVPRKLLDAGFRFSHESIEDALGEAVGTS